MADLETIAEMEARHEQETKQLEDQVKLLLKGAKKSTRAQLEAQAIQMQFDLRGKQRDEMDELEEALEKLGVDPTKATAAASAAAARANAEEEERRKQAAIEAKRAKAQKKKDKRAHREEEREQLKEDIRAHAGPSLRELELATINSLLAQNQLRVKEVISDGNCLYHAIADQLGGAMDYAGVRRSAAAYMRAHSEEFAPFLGIEPQSSGSEAAFEAYCALVESPTAAEWGGDVEIKAIAAALRRPVHVYSADTPVLVLEETSTVGSESAKPPLRVTFHQHYYALGSHYNSVAGLPKA